MTLTNFQNGGRAAQIMKTRDGYEAFIGYPDERAVSRTGLQVVERRLYQRENAAIKFCTKWINS